MPPAATMAFRCPTPVTSCAASRQPRAVSCTAMMVPASVRTVAAAIATAGKQPELMPTCFNPSKTCEARFLITHGPAGLIALPAQAASVKFAGVPSGQVDSPVHLEFRVDGYSVKPASEGVSDGTGEHLPHFQLALDAHVWLACSVA